MSTPSRTLLALPVIAYMAVIVIVAPQEYHLARAVFGLPHVVAAALPVLIDVYVLAAFARQKDRAWAMLVMAATFGAAILVHTAETEFDGVPWETSLAAQLVLGGVIILVAWRVTELVHDDQARAAEQLADMARQKATEDRKAARREQQYQPPATKTLAPAPAGDEHPWPVTPENKERLRAWYVEQQRATGTLPGEAEGSVLSGWDRQNQVRTVRRSVIAAAHSDDPQSVAV